MELIKKDHNITVWVADFSDALFKYTVLRIRDKHAAQDLVQDTFLAAWRNLDNYTGEASVKTWLFTILKNKITDHYRKTARNQTDLPGSDGPFFDESDHWKDGFCPQDWGTSAEGRMESKEFFNVFNGCKSKLKEVHSTVFTMKYLDGMESEEICKAVGLSSSNYWVLIHRAKVQLRACLESNWFTR